MTDKKWSDQHFGRIWQSYTEHVLGGESEQADYTEYSLTILNYTERIQPRFWRAFPMQDARPGD